MQSIELSVQLSHSNSSQSHGSTSAKLIQNQGQEGKVQEEDEEYFQLLIEEVDEIDVEGFDRKECHTMSIKLDDFYEVIIEEEIENIYSTEQEWKQFIAKVKQIGSDLNLTVKDVTSILSLGGQEKSFRKFVWEGVLEKEHQKKEISQDYPKEQQQLQGGEVTPDKKMKKIVMEELSSHDKKFIKQVDKNVKRMIEKWPELKEKTLEMERKIIRLVSEFTLNDKQISSPKGIEYLIFGLMIASPLRKHPKMYEKAFMYFLTHHKISSLYSNGESLYYNQELPLLLEEIKTSAPLLSEHIEKQNPDWSKLFLSYYKSLMLYKVKSPVLIGKLLDLLLIYGIKIVRIVLSKILMRKEKELMERFKDGKDIFRFLGTDIIIDYFNFEESQNKSIQTELKRLLIGSFDVK